MKAGIASAVIALVMPVCVYATTLRLSTDIDLLVLDGKKSPVRCCAGQTALNLITVPISLYFGWRKPFVSPVMNSVCTSLPAGRQL